MGGIFSLSLPSPEGNHTLLFEKPSRLVFEAFSWLSHSHGNSRGYSETCGGLGRMTPEAWHGPWWRVCQAVAGQGHRRRLQKPGPPAGEGGDPRGRHRGHDGPLSLQRAEAPLPLGLGHNKARLWRV